MRRVNKFLIAGIVILCLALAGHAAGLVAARYLAPRIEQSLGQRLNAQVRLRELDINWITGAHLAGIEIRFAAGSAGQCSAPGVRMSEVEIDHAIWPLFFGNYQITRVSVADAEACLDARRMQQLLSDSLSESAGQRIPAVEVQNAVVRIEHPELERALLVKKIRVSGTSRDNLRIRALATFDSGKNAVHADLSAGPSGIDAELWIKDFDPVSLPAFRTRIGPLAPAGFSLKKGISGKLTARYTPETGLLTIQSGLFASAAGAVEIFSGSMAFDHQGIGHAWIRAGAWGLDLARFDTLASGLVKEDKFRAQLQAGRVQARVSVRWNRAAGLDYEAGISVHNGTVFLPALDTEISGIEVDADVFSPGRVTIDKCTGQTAQGRIGMTGTLDFGKSGIVRHQLMLSLSGIRAGQNLRAILAPPLWRVIDQMQIQQATLDGRIHLAAGETSVDLRVSAREADLPDLPFHLQNPSTRIRWRSNTKQVLFSDFKTFLEGSPVKGQATLFLEKPLRTSFTLTGQYLPITQEMLGWLNMKKTPWQISGNYDVELRAHNWHPGSTSLKEALSNMKVQADLRELSLAHPEYGQVASNWYGHLAVNDSRIRMTDFTGEIYGVGFRANGRISTQDPAQTYLSLESQSITLEPALFDRIPFGSRLMEAGLQGQCELRAEFRTEGNQSLPTTGNLSAVIHHAEASVKNLKLGGAGTARVQVSGLGSPELRLDGRLNLQEAFAGGFEASRVSGDFQYRGGTLRIPDMRVAAYGGMVRFTDTQIRSATNKWQTRFSPEHMDLESIMAALGVSGRNAPSGSLRGSVSLAGRGWNPEALEGDGELTIKRGWLFEFPLIASVFNVLDLKLPRQSPATDAYIDFIAKDGRLRIRDMLISGGTAPMHLEGTIGLKKGIAFSNQGVDLLVTTAKTNGLLDQIPLINWVKHYTLDVFRRMAMQVRIKGTLGDYEVKRLSSIITTPVERMWSLMQKLAPQPPGE